MDFLHDLYVEASHRRRRLAGLFGPRGVGIVEALVFAGLVLGSAGLFLRPWGVGVAPWGLAIPVVYVAAFVFIERRRQRDQARPPAPAEALHEAEAADIATAADNRRDWTVLGLGAACAAIGFATFFYMISQEPSRPQPPTAVEADAAAEGEERGWTPPPNTPEADLAQ